MKYVTKNGSSETTIRRKRHDGDNPYVTLSRDCIDDPKLSWKARGILHWMLGRPDNWSFNSADMVNRSDKDGKESLATGLKELVERGYVEIVRTHTETGQFGRTFWYVDEFPFRSVDTSIRRTEPDYMED